MTFDMNDAEPQKTSELIPDGTFAKVTMTIRHGGIDGQSEVDQRLLKASNTPASDVLMLDAEFTVADGREGQQVRRAVGLERAHGPHQADSAGPA